MEHAQRATQVLPIINVKRDGLNPYFNGTCSKSATFSGYDLEIDVLILILMEHAQRDELDMERIEEWLGVLILILMEHAQRVWKITK